ncbi:hypothetical protein HPB49_021693 [Dermacentor silvarum]|uniref:Uncharacterized protein n=1 Tax=Dermacentor silvarum TaxID=543639 RepID=A0ACB8CMZ6_DERSI|nr:hypothetical protein HPB49_021693 [Dermacentor silvarum]
MEWLPLTLLTPHCTFHSDATYCSSELVCGTTLRLPGQFVDPSSAVSLYIVDFAIHLKMCYTYSPGASSWTTIKRESFVNHAIRYCAHLFVQRDVIRSPLQPHHDAPLKIFKRCPKHFVLFLNGCEHTTSLDRIKHAYLNTYATFDGDNHLVNSHRARFTAAYGAVKCKSLLLVQAKNRSFNQRPLPCASLVASRDTVEGNDDAPHHDLHEVARKESSIVIAEERVRLRAALVVSIMPP